MKDPLLENKDNSSNSELKVFIEEIQKLYDPTVDKDKDVNQKINEYIFGNNTNLLGRLQRLNEELENDVNGQILQNPENAFNRQLTTLINKVVNKEKLYEIAFNSIEEAFEFTKLLDKHYIINQPERLRNLQFLRNRMPKMPKMSSISKNVNLPSMPKLPQRSRTPKPKTVDLTNMDTVINFMENDTTLIDFLMEHKPEEKSNPDPYLVILNNFEEFIKIQKDITRDFKPKLNFYNLVFKQLEYETIFDLCKEHLFNLIFFNNPNILLNDDKNSFIYKNNKLNYKNTYSISIDNLIYSVKKKEISDLDKELDKATKDAIGKQNFSNLEISVRIKLLKRFQKACIEKMYESIKSKYNLIDNETQSEERFEEYVNNMISSMLK